MNNQELKAQLAEAVGLLQQQCDADLYGAKTEHIEAFLARHAQAEEQQGGSVPAKAGSLQYEMVTLSILLHERDLDHAKVYETTFAGSATLQAGIVDLLEEVAELRAQPAAIKLPDRKRTDHLPAEYKTMTPTRASIESYNRALDDVAALNAVRGAEHE